MQIERTCEKRYSQPLADVWALFSQIGSVLEYMGLEPYDIVGKSKKKTPYRTGYAVTEIGRTGHKLFKEKPLEWVKEKLLVVDRIYEDKPYTNWVFRIDLIQKGKDVTVVCQLKATPRPTYISTKRTKRLLNQQKERFEKILTSVDLFFEKDLLHPFPRKEGAYIPKSAHKLKDKIEKSGYGHRLGHRLLDHMFQGLVSEVQSIRPHHLAQQWQKPILDITELLMKSAYSGLLSYQWYMACSSCGHSQAPVDRLERLPKTVKCVSCGETFARDFSENVELIFAPQKKVRKSMKGTYAFMDPSRRRRTLFHVYVPAKKSISLDVCLQQDEILTFFVEQTHENISLHELTAKGLNFVLTKEGVSYSTHEGSRGRNVHIQNEREEGVFVSLRMPYGKHMRYTGMEAITSHAFRELCPEDVPDRTDEIPLSNATIMFTDLKASTQLYEDIGDLRAYHMVRDHFQVMETFVRYYDGALVKNIGDAVMAVFTRPIDAVRAGIAIHNEMNIFNAQYNAQYKKRKAVLKMGIHTGACIAVLMNNRIDFFGQMLNVAARLQDKSKGHDMVLSIPVVADPEVAAVVRSYKTSSEEEHVKGVQEKVPFLRVSFGDALFEEELPEEDLFL